jgi:aminodeoxyfutalosine synthase
MNRFGEFSDIAEKVENQIPLNFEDGVRLYQTNNLPLLGELAGKVRARLNQRKVYYSVNLHLNHTNVCVLRCLFCAFARRPGEAGGYTISPDEVAIRVREGIEKWNINEIHIVGGHNPDLGMDYYTDLFNKIREVSTSIYIKALTAPEIDDLAIRCDLPHLEVLKQLQQAGLNGMPGGGAEIFAPVTRKKICHEKISAERWLEIHETAHSLGLKTNATMLYGHIESAEDRVDHVLRLRDLQEKTKGFYSFIPLAYNSENNPLQKLGEAGGYLDAKVWAISRLLFHNIPHIKAHWITTGLKMGQVALSFGVDDLGGLNLNEKIVHDAGSDTPLDLTSAEMERLIQEAGYEPCLVDSSYEYISQPI